MVEQPLLVTMNSALQSKCFLIPLSFIVYSTSHNLFLLLFNLIDLQDPFVLFKYRMCTTDIGSVPHFQSFFF